MPPPSTRPPRSHRNPKRRKAAVVESLKRDLEGVYRLQCLQMWLIRNLQRELEQFEDRRSS